MQAKIKPAIIRHTIADAVIKYLKPFQNDYDLVNQNKTTKVEHSTRKAKQ